MHFFLWKGEYRTFALTPVWFVLIFWIKSCFATAQVKEIAVRGYVFGEGEAQIALDNVNIQNLRTGRGAISLRDGYFQLSALPGDTIKFSSVGYQMEFMLVDASLRGRIIRVNLKRSTYLLEEVHVRSYKLTTNLPREMPQGKPTYKPNEQIREPRPAKATLASPVDYIYQMFDRRFKQMEILDEYTKRDAFITKLEEGNNMNIVMEITGLSKEEFREFIFFCQMGEDFIYSATDYELIMSMLRCYRQYKRVKDINEYMGDFD